MKEHIQATTPDQRAMSKWDLFATWIGANANNGTWYIGGVIAAVGLIKASTLLVIVGSLSYVLLALASYMGFKTGLPAMTLTRPSFGVKGSILKDILGWNNSAFHNQFSIIIGIVVMSILHLISISVGEKSVKWIERFGIILVIILVTWESIVVLKTVPFHEIVKWQPAAKFQLPSGKIVDILAAFNLAWVTAAADFSRFTKDKHAATTVSFFGANIGLFWFAFIGLIATIATAITINKFDPNNADPSTIAAKLGLGILAMLVIVITSTTANAVNLMAAGSAMTNIFHKLKLTPALWIVTLVATVMTFIPVYVASFLTTFETFLDGIGMFLGPEIAIFLVDFFFIKKKDYQVSELSKPQGKYWYTKGVNLMAITTWAIGVLSYLGLNKLDFIVQTVGATFPAMIFTAILYYLVSARTKKINTI